MSGARCPMCNGSMEYETQYQRLTVCIDCWDALSGRTRGATRQKWMAEDRSFIAKLRGQRRRRPAS